MSRREQNVCNFTISHCWSPNYTVLWNRSTKTLFIRHLSKFIHSTSNRKEILKPEIACLDLLILLSGCHNSLIFCHLPFNSGIFSSKLLLVSFASEQWKWTFKGYEISYKAPSGNTIIVNCSVISNEIPQSN